MDERAQEPRCGLAQLLHQVSAAVRALDRLAGLGKYTLDLFVELVAVRDDHYARLRVILQDPLGQQDHHDALAAPLRVPDDAALLLLDALLRDLDAEVLVRAR